MKNNLPAKQTDFLLYTGSDCKGNVEVFLKNETVWLAQKATGHPIELLSRKKYTSEQRDNN